MTIQARADNNNEPFVLDDTAEVIDGITLAAEQGDITTGAVLGEVTATPGTYKVVSHTVSDGSQVPKLILATPNVASDGSTTTNLSAYCRGLFDENQLTFASDGAPVTDLDSRIAAASLGEMTIRDALRVFNIRLAPGLSVSKYQNPAL
jgi:hypothetical protein